MKKNVLILMSGGIDSTALAKYYLNLNYKVQGLFIDYGQVANIQEKKSIEKVSKHFGIQINKVEVSLNKNLSTGEITGRNLMLLSIALTDFPSDFGIIAIGIHNGTRYGDCTPQFIESSQKIFDIYKDGGIQIEAPFKDLLKNDIWKYCIDNEVPIDLTYSCENGNFGGCGVCLSCLDKESLNEFSKK